MFGALGAAGRGARTVRPFRGHPPEPDRRRAPPRRPGHLDVGASQPSSGRSPRPVRARPQRMAPYLAPKVACFLHAVAPRKRGLSERVGVELTGEPVSDGGLVEFSGGDRQHGGDGLVKRDLQLVAVESTEHGQCLPSQALVAARQRMVPRDAYDEDRCLVHELGIEPDLAESSLGACSAESSNSKRAARERIAASIPVTALAMASASARVRYLTRRDDRGSLCLAWSELLELP